MDKPKMGGPYLAAAVIADRMIVENDQVISAMRIVDQITLPPAPFKNGEIVGMPQTLVLMFKAGNFRGKRRLRVTLVQPSGKTSLSAVQELDFAQAKGDQPEAGVNFGMPLMIVWGGPGLYWFDIHLGEKLMAKVPFRLHLAEGVPVKVMRFGKKVDNSK